MHRSHFRCAGLFSGFLFRALLIAGCSSSTPVQSAPDASPDASLERTATKLAPLESVSTTEKQTIVPTRTPASDPRSPAVPDDLTSLLKDGFGDSTIGPGEAPVMQTSDGSTPPAAGPSRKRLLRMVHAADFQLADDESPARVAGLDGPGLGQSAFRPQEGHECRVLNAVVRTINALHKADAIDFVLLGGDNCDNAQSNELNWVLALLNGSDKPLACDSGEMNDPIAGPDNDGKDPFIPSGLDTAWYWVMGNHDILMQGNFPVDTARKAQAIGNYTTGGTRDYRKPGGPVVSREQVPADPARAMMTRADLVDRVVGDAARVGPKGHGLGTYSNTSKKAYYALDVANTPLRFLVLDTAAETGGAEGLIRRGDLEGFVKPELERAKNDQKWVVLASHHATDHLTNGGEYGGTPQSDAVLAAEWLSLVTSYGNVVLDLVGHAHAHRIQYLGAGDSGFWEVQTSAIADYPHEFRVVEIFDEDNGYLSIRTSAVDYAADGDAVATEGRKIGIVDYTSSNFCCGTGTAKDRNAVLWRKKPFGN